MSIVDMELNKDGRKLFHIYVSTLPERLLNG